MKRTPFVPSGNLVDLLLDAICVVDRSGHFVFVSAACERIFGYSAAEMIGTPMIDMVHPEDRERTLQAASEIMAGDSKPRFENRYIRKDGQVVQNLPLPPRAGGGQPPPVFETPLSRGGGGGRPPPRGGARGGARPAPNPGDGHDLTVLA